MEEGEAAVSLAILLGGVRSVDEWSNAVAWVWVTQDPPLARGWSVALAGAAGRGSQVPCGKNTSGPGTLVSVVFGRTGAVRWIWDPAPA